MAARKREAVIRFSDGVMHRLEMRGIGVVQGVKDGYALVWWADTQVRTIEALTELVRHFEGHRRDYNRLESEG